MNLIARAFDALANAGIRVYWYGNRRNAMPQRRYVAVSRGRTEPIGNGPAAHVTVELLACVPTDDYPAMQDFLSEIREAMAQEPGLAFTGRIGETRAERSLGVCTMMLEYVGIEDGAEEETENE